MLFGARIRGQGMRVCLGWCARSACAALRKLSRRKQNECGLHCLLTLSAPPIGGYLSLRGISVKPSK